MLDLRFQQTNRKTFLSPECLTKIRTIQSPKFDKQKAQQDQIRRKMIYEEKLARYDQYNSILSAKAKKQINSLRGQLKQQNSPNIKTKKNQPVINEQKSTKIPQKKSSRVKNTQIINKINKQQNLEQLRYTNRTLHTKNAELKSYLKQLNSGVSQLECILQEVEVTYNSLKQVNPEFKGLWILNQHEQHDEYIKSEKNTKDTVDFEYERREGAKYVQENDYNLMKKKNKVDCSSILANQRLEAIDSLQHKFNYILQRIAKRQGSQIKIDAQLSQLNAIEQQLDQLKRSSMKQTLQNSKSQRSVQIPIKYTQQQVSHYQPLNKVKSLGRIFA